MVDGGGPSSERRPPRPQMWCVACRSSIECMGGAPVTKTRTRPPRCVLAREATTSSTRFSTLSFSPSATQLCKKPCGAPPLPWQQAPRVQLACRLPVGCLLLHMIPRTHTIHHCARLGRAKHLDTVNPTGFSSSCRRRRHCARVQLFGEARVSVV